MTWGQVWILHKVYRLSLLGRLQKVILDYIQKMSASHVGKWEDTIYVEDVMKKKTNKLY